MSQIPTVVTQDEHDELHAQLIRAFGATAAAGEPSRTATYAGFTWTRIKDNDKVKFVRSGQLSPFEQNYAQESMPSKQQRIGMKEGELMVNEFTSVDDPELED